jgi:hypothetical protein
MRSSAPPLSVKPRSTLVMLYALLLVMSGGVGWAAPITYRVSGSVLEATGTAAPFFTVGDPALLEVTFEEEELVLQSPTALWAGTLDVLRLTLPGIDISTSLFLDDGYGDVRLVDGASPSQGDAVSIEASPLFVLSDPIYNRFFMTDSSVTIDLDPAHWIGAPTPEVDYSLVTTSYMRIDLHDAVGGGAQSFVVEVTDFSVIPEPSTALLLGIGLSALAVRREKR